MDLYSDMSFSLFSVVKLCYWRHNQTFFAIQFNLGTYAVPFGGSIIVCLCCYAIRSIFAVGKGSDGKHCFIWPDCKRTHEADVLRELSFDRTELLGAYRFDLKFL